MKYLKANTLKYFYLRFLLLLIGSLFLEGVFNQQEKLFAKDKSRKDDAQQNVIWYAYDPVTVVLEGTLAKDTAYGPPGYGENPKIDKKEKYYTLNLDKPINIKGDPNSDLNSETIKRIKKIQLDTEPSVNLEEMVGKRVIVKGRIYHSITGHDHTKVIIDLIEISLNNQTSHH